MYLYVYWLRKGPSIKCILNWWGDCGSSKMRKAANRGREGLSRLMCTYALALSLFMIVAAFLS